MITTKKERAIIVDLGGTLAHRGDRPKESYLERFCEDAVDVTVRELVNMESAAETMVIVLTGQREKSRKVTRRWLYRNGVSFDMLVMKPDDDCRDSKDFKQAFYREVIEGNIEVKYVLEDREDSVEMWRQMGVRCFQTASGQDREHYGRLADE